ARGAEELHGEPDPESRKPARQVGPVRARIVHVVRRRAREVLGGGPVHGAERCAVADEERAGAVREKEALVWIERERVSAREAFEERAELRAGVEEGAVSAVDVV